MHADRSVSSLSLYLCVGALVAYLGQHPVCPVVSWKEDGIVCSRLLLQLDGYRDQLVVSIHVQKAHRGRAGPPLLAANAIKDFQVTYVDMAALKMRITFMSNIHINTAKHMMQNCLLGNAI